MTILRLTAWRLGALLVAAAMAGGCGSASIAEHAVAPAMHAVAGHPPVGLSRHSATVRFGEGRQSVGFALHVVGGFIHILLVIAVILVIWNLIAGRQARL